MTNLKDKNVLPYWLSRVDIKVLPYGWLGWPNVCGKITVGWMMNWGELGSKIINK